MEVIAQEWKGHRRQVRIFSIQCTFTLHANTSNHSIQWSMGPTDPQHRKRHGSEQVMVNQADPNVEKNDPQRTQQTQQAQKKSALFQGSRSHSRTAEGGVSAPCRVRHCCSHFPGPFRGTASASNSPKRPSDSIPQRHCLFHPVDELAGIGPVHGNCLPIVHVLCCNCWRTERLGGTF